MKLLPTAIEDLLGVWRLMRKSPPRLARFAMVGAVSTLAYVLIYLALRTVTDTHSANVVALGVTAFANTAANRRFTFGVQGRVGLAGDYFAGLTAFAIALAMTSAAAEALRYVAPHASNTVEVSVLVGANLFATCCRYMLFRGWMDGRLQVMPADGA